MGKVERFEDLIAWQKAKLLAVRVYALTRKPAFSKDFGLASQIQRASVSVMSNIAEGFERSGNKEFAQFLSIAKASAGEVRSQLYLAKEIGYIDAAEFAEVCDLAVEAARIVSGLRSSIL